MDSGNSCGFAATGDITDTDPHLGPLQDNGGGTYTQALLPGSPATDAGNPATCMVAPVNGVDQRGFPRDAACDIGAYEVEKYAALDIVKRVSSDTVWSGERLTYTIQVTNTGNVALTATITDSLPDHVSPGGTLTWTAPISASGCVWTEQFTVTVELGYSGPLTNVVRATTEEGATGAYTHTVTVYGAPVAGFTSSSPDWSGETTAFTNTTTGHGSLTYLWSFGDGVTSTLESPTHTYSAAGTCTVALTATNSAGSSVATDAVTIYDTPVVDFSSAVYSASEDAGAVNITVTLDAVSDLTVTVDYVASDGTATAGSDYVVISGTLIFTPGVTSQVIVVAIIDDDVVEGEEVVILTLTDPHNAVLGDHSPAALTITETFRIYLPQVLRYQVLAP